MNKNNANFSLISACIVVHNEEKMIARCLESIKNIVDEIILIHDGPCSDRTLEIAKNYNAIIIVSDYIGEAEPLRPLSYQSARGEWILQVDADEFLSPELSKSILSLIDNQEVDAYEFLWPLFDGITYRTKYWPYKRCLFRKSKISFLGLPHYVIEVEGKIKRLPLLLEHRPLYNNYSLRAFKKKWIKWAKIYARLVSSGFSHISKFHYIHKMPFSIRLRLRVPWLCIFIDPIIIFFKVLISGAWKEGWYGYWVASLNSIFRISINWFIMSNKIFRKKI